MQADITLSQTEVENRTFIRHVYNWMTGGLAVTGLISWYMAANPVMIVGLMRTPFVFYGLLIAELALVFALAGWVKRMSWTTAAWVFIMYSALNGVTMSVIFLMYTASSIATTFFITAGTFAGMSLYGYTTKTDLTSVGSFCIMGLWGVILGSIVNMWLQNSAVYWVTTYASIAIFIGLTAYDTQKIKAMNIIGNEGTEEDTLEAISGALTLYLDFINLFLQLLRIFGRRRD